MRKIVGVMGGASLLLLGLFILPATAQFSIGPLLGYYTPSDGEVKAFGRELEIRSGLAYGLAAEYNLTPSLKIRGEYFSFESDSSESFLVFDLGTKTRMSPLLVSAIYKIRPGGTLCPYLGAGIGMFSSELELSVTDTTTGIRTSSKESDNPTGFQLLAGAEYGLGENFLLLGEARYVIAKTGFMEFEEFMPLGFKLQRTDIDWGGWFLSLGVSYKF